MAIDTSFLKDAGDIVSCDECTDRFRILDLGDSVTARGEGRVVEHYDARTGDKCDVSFYCSDECRDVNAPPALALAPDDDE